MSSELRRAPRGRLSLLIDAGAEFAGYASDITRTYSYQDADFAALIERMDRMQQALNISVRRVERSWAGLRTFTPDGSLAIGWDAASEGFFWCVGQGGYGIQTSPAAGRLVKDMVTGRDLGSAAGIIGVVDPRRFRPPPRSSLRPA